MTLADNGQNRSLHEPFGDKNGYHATKLSSLSLLPMVHIDNPISISSVL